MTKRNNTNALEKRLRNVLIGEYTGLAISFMEEILHQDDALGEDHILDFLTQVGHREIVDRDGIATSRKYWNIQWYPNTPIGSCSIIAPTLTRALHEMDEGDDATAWEQRLFSMLGADMVSFEIEFDEHRLSYESLENSLASRVEWVSAKDKQTAMRDQHAWIIQFRLRGEKDTTIWAAAALENLIVACEKSFKKDDTAALVEEECEECGLADVEIIAGLCFDCESKDVFDHHTAAEQTTA